MALPQIISRNQQQNVRRIHRGSRITVLGSGGFTQAAVFEGIVNTYQPAAGKTALIRGSFTSVSMGTNTRMGAMVTDQSLGLNIELAVTTAANQTIDFQTVLSDDDIVSFFGDNAADDGTAHCEIEVTERPTT